MKFKISVLEKSMLNELKPLIMNCRFKPYQEYDIPQNRLVNYVMDEVKHALSFPNGLVLVCEEKEELVGLVSANKLDWDTKHFGIEMAKIEHLVAGDEYSKSFDIKSALLSSLLKESLQKHVQHLTAAVYTEDISSLHALESKGFRIMDTHMSYSLDLHKCRPSEFKNQYVVREFRESDLEHLAKIARVSFTGGRIATDRFHADPSLSKEKSDELYVEWIVNSCRGLADVVLVAEIDDTPVGFLTCKILKSLDRKLGKRFGSIILNAVSPPARQKGVYSNLVNSALRWLAGQVDIVEVGTQIGNYVVQKVWTKFGFGLIRSQHLLTYSRTNKSSRIREERQLR